MKDVLIKNIGNRKIVFWGCSIYQDDKNQISHFWKEVIKKEKLEVAFCVDSDYGKCGENVKFHYELKNQKEKYYVIVLCRYYEEIYKLLEEYGYTEHKDFIYVKHQPVIIKSTYDYIDKYNNRIEGRLPQGGEIMFSGYNARVIIGRNFKFHGKIEVRNNSCLIIGDNIVVEDASPWLVSNNGYCTIGSGCKFKKTGLINVLDEAKLIIGDDSTFESDYHFSIQPYTTCEFGKDCMASNELSVRTNDGHTIFDNILKDNVNSKVEISKNRKIIIKDHVWIGRRCAILYNTYIDTNCIVGLGSVVKGTFESNSMLAGVPAKVIKNNVSWSREKIGNYVEDNRL